MARRRGGGARRQRGGGATRGRATGGWGERGGRSWDRRVRVVDRNDGEGRRGGTARAEGRGAGGGGGGEMCRAAREPHARCPRENEGGGEGCHVSARRPASTQNGHGPNLTCHVPGEPFRGFRELGERRKLFFHLRTLRSLIALI